MAEKPPAFQFYPRDFVGDLDVAAQTLEQVGFYTLLLCYAWLKDGLPNDFDKLSRALHVRKTRFTFLWAVVGEKFCLAPDGRFRNERQEEERAKQEGHRRERAASGKAGAEKRWVSHQKKDGTAIRSAIAEPMAKDSSSSASASASASAIEEVHPQPPSVSEDESVAKPTDAPEPAKVARVPKEKPELTVTAVMSLWNTRCPSGIPQAVDRSVYEKVAAARLKEHPERQWWEDTMARVWASDFLMGRVTRAEGHQNWRPDLGWFLKPASIEKIVSGKYDNKPVPLVGAGRTVGNQAALEAVLNRKRGDDVVE